MPSPSAAWSALVLATGVLFPAQSRNKWNSRFDYTNLPHSNEAFWEPLAKAQVPMEQALELVAESEAATIRPLSVELKPAQEGAYWDLQVFAGGEEGAPRRVNLRVSAAEPKVLHRLELLALAEDEKAAWKVLAKAQVSAAVAIQLCKDRSAGDKLEPTFRDPRMRTLRFVPEPSAPVWEAELMGNEWRKDAIRRMWFSLNAAKPMVKRKFMLDRFSGEPLRNNQPTELGNGVYLHDFSVGDGPQVTSTSKVTCHYQLFLLDNTKLHDTWKTNLPETFPVSSAPLKGMSEGLVGMRVGGKRKIAMPYALAFGEAGNEIAPPRAMVVCDVVVRAIVDE